MPRPLQRSEVRLAERAPHSLGPETPTCVSADSRTGGSAVELLKRGADTPDTFVRLARPQQFTGASPGGQAASASSLRSRRKRPEMPEYGLRLEWSPPPPLLQATEKDRTSSARMPEELPRDGRPVQVAPEKEPPTAQSPAAAASKRQELSAPSLSALPIDALPSLADVTPQDLSRPGVREKLAETLRTSPAYLAGASEAVRSDRELVLTALQNRVRMGRGWKDVVNELRAQIGKSLLDDAEVALACIRIVPDFLNQLPDSVKTPALVREALERGAQCSDPKWLEDREMALAGARAGGVRVSDLPAAHRGDEEIVLAALGKTKRLTTIKPEEVFDFWKSIDPSLREDQGFQKRAVLANPAFLQVADKKLQGDRELVLETVRRCGSALQFAGPELQRDREVVRTAVEGDGVALQFAHEELRADRGIALSALKDTVEAYPFLPESLKTDPEILLKVARMFPGMLSDVNLEGQSRDFLLQMVREHSRVFVLMPESVKQDRQFQIECAMSYPPMLDADLADQKSALLEASPELRMRYESVTRELGELGIESASRIHNARLLEEVLRNRKNPSVDDGRPVAVVTFPKAKADASGAAEWASLVELTQGYRVLYYEVGAEEGLIDALKDGGKGRPADLVLVVGHGLSGLTSLGWGGGTPKDADVLDLGDERQLVNAGVERFVQPDASIVLGSCSTGSGREKGDNNANMLARVFPGRQVLAPVVNSSFHLKFDEQGRFSDPGYVGGSETLYRARVAKE